MTDTRKEFNRVKYDLGDDFHLSLLMANYGLNFVTGKDRQDMLSWGKDIWQACQSLNDKRIQQLLAVIEVQREALKFYADGEHIKHLSNGECTFEYGDIAKKSLAIKPENVELVEVATFVEDKMFPASFNQGTWDFVQSPADGYELGSKLYNIKTKPANDIPSSPPILTGGCF